MKRLVFVGGGARQRSLCQSILPEGLGIGAQIGDPLVRMGRTAEVAPESGIDRRLPQPAWTVAIGLSMGTPWPHEQSGGVIDHDRNPMNCSFLPDDYQHRRVRRRTKVVGAAAVLVVMLAIGSDVFIAERSLSTVEHATTPSATLAYNETATRRIDTFRHQRRRTARICSSAPCWPRPLTDGVPRSNILAELTNALPVGTSLIEMNLESRPRPETPAAGNTAFDMKKAALESQRHRRKPSEFPTSRRRTSMVKVSGLADTDVQVAQYLKQLSRSLLFRDVNLLISESHGTSGNAIVTLRRFQIQMTVNPSARPQLTGPTWPRPRPPPLAGNTIGRITA